MIKHISFDLWQTLIRSNPEFRQKRAEMIVDKFQPKNKNAQEVMQFIVDEDKIFDHINETQNTKVPAIEMFSAILEKLEVLSQNSIEKDAEILKNLSDELFLKYPPMLLNENISSILRLLNDEGYTINLGSNTGFIEGDTLKILFENLDIAQYFSFYIFSDEVKISKPANGFFQHILEKTLLQKSEILHIGDNPILDFQAAKDFGFEALLITENYTIDDIKRKL